MSLSEQQLVDCSKQNSGCNGGIMDYAFSYAEKHAIERESDYPYKGVDERCEYTETKGIVKATSFRDVP